MTLSKRIRDCRYAKGWGTDELAVQAEISRTALYQIESGKTEKPRASTLRRIAKALDISMDVLLDVKPKENSRSNSPVMAQAEFSADHARVPLSTSSFGPRLAVNAAKDLDRKFHELLESPLGEGLARIIEESYRLLPVREVG